MVRGLKEAQVERVYTRERGQHRSHPLPLAVVFDDSPVSPKHRVTLVEWTAPARAKLVDLDRHLRTLRPLRALPTTALRGRIHVVDDRSLRVDRALGLGFRAPPTL